MFTPLLVAFVSGVLLLRVSLLLLLTQLWSECSYILICIGRLFFLVDCVDHGPLLSVSFDPVVSEEGLIGIFDCKTCLVLVRKQFADAFRCGSPEDLWVQESVVGLDAVVGKGSEVVLRVWQGHQR